VLDPVLTEIKKLKSVRKQAHTGAFTREKILEKTRKYLVRLVLLTACVQMARCALQIFPRRSNHTTNACLEPVPCEVQNTEAC